MAAPPSPKAVSPRPKAQSQPMPPVENGKSFAQLEKVIRAQSWAIGILGLMLVCITPFAQPIYSYYARKPDNTAMAMVGLTMPNMTNQAVLSWATTSITEVLTMGFGDINKRLPLQRNRFTKDGWNAYIEVFNKMKIGQAFKTNQLVLTTVPSNTPIIASQGVNADDVYQWVVQMPVVMTYATNSLPTKINRNVILTIVRVPTTDNPFGLAIRQWIMG